MSKQKQKNSIRTQIMPVMNCSDLPQLQTIMGRCGTARALTYNKLGSLQGWGTHWKQAFPVIRQIQDCSDIGIPSNIYEWSVNDCFKAITAQQEAAKVAIIKKIYQKYSVTQTERDRKEWLETPEGKRGGLEAAYQHFPETKTETARKCLLTHLRENPTSDSWLHRQFRKEYVRGHTFQRNQIVYQKRGYKVTRLSRYRILLEVAGLERGKRISLIIKTNRLPTGQIRVIEKDGRLEIHTAFTQELPQHPEPQLSLGMDKGYTEGFYLSDGRVVAPTLGKKLTIKTERITKVNRNRSRLYAHAKKHSSSKKRHRIFNCNLTRQVQDKKLNRDKAEIKGLIRHGLRQVFTEPTIIYAEDLSSPIRGKKGAKRINRKLNSWMKGELQTSLERIGELTGSTVQTVNPAYTSQVDCLTGTLLGGRKGDHFIRYTEDVLQGDYNAAQNIQHRGTDVEIPRYMKYQEVRKVLLHRTVRYLHSLGYSVADALTQNWLDPDFEKEAMAVEADYPPVRYRERLSTTEAEYIQLALPL